MAEKKTKKETAPKKKEAKHETKAAAPAPTAAKATKTATPAPSAKEARIGVFICHCGTNIAGSIDIKEVEEYAKTLLNVAYAANYQYVCSTPGQKIITDAIKEHNLTGTVVAACSPRLHEPTFRTATKEGGLNPFRFEMANIREQGSWVHMHDREGATAKAKDAIRIAVAKASLLQDLIPKSVPVEKAAMVVGAGIAGMQAALDLANARIKTYLIEKSPTTRTEQILLLHDRGIGIGDDAGGDRRPLDTGRTGERLLLQPLAEPLGDRRAPTCPVSGSSRANSSPP